MKNQDNKGNSHLFHVVEELNDIMTEAPTLQKGLAAGLFSILEVIHRPGTALYLPIPDGNLPYQWLTQHLPEAWTLQIQDPTSAIYQIVDQVFADGQPLVFDCGLDIAGCVPIWMKSEVMGVLFVQGDVLSESDLAECVTLLRPFGRAIFNNRLHNVDANLSKDLAALKIFASSLNADSNINDVQLWILRGIKELFNSEAAILILLDDDNPEIAIKKTITNDPEWHTRSVLKVETSLAVDCIRSGQPYYVADVNTDPVFNVDFDSVEGINVQSALCTPLISNSQTLGVVEVVNIPRTPLNTYELSLLASMTKSLANSIFSMYLIQQLKVTNADLEASRWELLHSRNTLRALFDSIPASIYIVDRKYSLIAINMSRSERANNRPNLLVGKKCYEALFQRMEPCPSCRVKETLVNGRTTTRNDRQWISNDHPVDWDISTFAILDSSSLPTQAIVLEQDITEKRRLEANLIQTEKLAAVGQLAAGVAHEINNPLSAIIANAQILLRDLPADDQDSLESVKLIETAGLRASQVVRNLLGFARKEQIEFSPIDLNDTIRASLSLIQHELVSRPITLTTNLEEGMPKINGSRDHLQGVWINMILNAIDAIENKQGEIKLSSRFIVNEFRVTVQDTGKGIQPDRISRVFEPFFTTKALGHGTGLGLSVCHRIVKQHGGYIEVDSHIGVGTKFTIVLPASGH
jgi:two-component system NtrC family sensor kinase